MCIRDRSADIGQLLIWAAQRDWAAGRIPKRAAKKAAFLCLVFSFSFVIYPDLTGDRVQNMI